MRRLSVLFTALAAVALVLASCSSSTGPSDGGGDDGGGSGALPTRTISGTVDVATGSTLDAGDLRVMTFAGWSDVGSNGSFTVDAIDSDTYQWLVFTSRTSGNPVMLGLYDPGARSVMANTTSTALALTMSLPHLVWSGDSDRQSYVQQVQLDGGWTTLEAALVAAWETDAETALDYETNPVIYQQVVEIARNAMETLGSGGRDGVDPPHLEYNGGVGEIDIVNPRHIWYTLQQFEWDWTPSGTWVADRDDEPDFEWGWPTVVTAAPRTIHLNVNDGTYFYCFEKGDDFTMIDQWSDAVGRATALNTTDSADHLLELVTGYRCSPNPMFLGDHVNIPSIYANELSQALVQRQPERFVSSFWHLMAQYSDDWSDWMWDGDAPGAAEDYLEAVGWIAGDVCFAIDLLSYNTDSGPFWWDWCLVDESPCYEVEIVDGIVSSMGTFYGPDAEFTIAPPAGVVGTEFEFDATLTVDDEDPIGSLQFRWDWESDGTWDADWSSSQQRTHTYTQGGAYTVTMQAKDTDDLIGTVTHNVNVGGGAGSANHVKLFLDMYPWYSTATLTVLESLGFTEGTGPDTYEVLSSTSMSWAELVPGEDLVIICNDQPQGFYDSYAANQIRFNNFVHQGGSLLWEACDQGWNLGSMANAGVVLPGDVGLIFDYDWLNYVDDPVLPLVSGLPETLDHNYASHESFTDLPDGATVYCRDESWNPTLVEYSVGGGWVVMSGQPLEHQFDYVYGKPDMDELLPRIISYFTGRAIRKEIPGYEPSLSNERPSKE
jgi:hypothetical protein